MAEEKKDDKKMPFLKHLEELRWRLVKSSVAILIIATVLFIYTDPIIKHVYLAMSEMDFPTYRFFCWTSQSLGLEDALCGTEIPIDIQSIEMTQQFATNMYFAIVGGFLCLFPVAVCLFHCVGLPFLLPGSLFFRSWVVFLVAGVPRLTAGPPDGSRPALQCARLPPQGSCFQS